MNNKFYIQAVKTLALIILVLVLCRFTKGRFSAVIVLTGIWAAFQKRYGLAICCYVLIPLIVVLNPALIRKVGMTMPILRFGALLIGLSLVVVAAKRSGKHRIPFGGIIPFLLVAFVSSSGGYAPKISYLKIANYFIFLLGLWLGTQNLQNRPKDVFLIRTMFFAMVLFLVFGSLALIPFPGISYSTGLLYAIREGGIEYAEEVFRDIQETGGTTLFGGVTWHSQTLAPVLALSFAWVLCDMLFVEKRLKLGHLVVLGLILPMMYMTRSRTAFVATAAGFVLVYFYGLAKVKISPRVKQHVGMGLLVMSIFIVFVAGIVQLRNQTISRWLRKGQDVSGDTRSLTEAMTASRMGLVEESMRDFRQNPMFGMGFQVAWYNESLEKSGKLVLSAPIEKGVLPTMVLGETGIVGATCFVIFLVSFYMTASNRKLFTTVTLFGVLLACNMGEATFFSPGGQGGLLWIMAVVGGFTIDTVLLYERNMKGQWDRAMRSGNPLVGNRV